MIRVERIRNDENGNPIRPNEAWFESARLRTEIAKSEGTGHDAESAIYHHNQVHAALEELFYRKCAYCEAWPTSSSDWDVEHFRPKGHYYWLSYHWPNLYLSCQHCNQSRRDRPTWDDSTVGASAGKLDQFPLVENSPRSMGPDDDIDHEERMLIDPCTDDPEEHVTFDNTGMALARVGSTMGQTSIEVFNLQRRRLVDDRAVIVGAHLKNVRLLAQHKSIEEAVRDLVDVYGGDHLPFAGVARAIARDPASFGL